MFVKLSTLDFTVGTLTILIWPLKCSQETGKTIKGRNPKVQFFLGHPVCNFFQLFFYFKKFWSTSREKRPKLYFGLSF